MVLDRAIAHNYYNVERPRSPAPEANDDLAKVKFCSEIAKAKNALASGVGCSALFYITTQDFVIVE